ncbi:MAG TPA: hypothetical protein EYQ54_15780 [Myxococcales bacterium]|nr:hypothetical protein [Myxococcales bacterium]
MQNQPIYSAEELLSNHPIAEPLIANGVRCHGGFDKDGAYSSPRTLARVPAIAAWQAQLARDGAPLIEIPRDLMPPQYPNVAQAKLLLRNGVREPLVRALTVISIVEGFGAMIRDVRVPDLQSLFVEPIDGTALAHLSGGLFEAHARDESGYRDEGGHKQMWEAARDAALENPKIPGDVLMRLMGRRGRSGPPKAAFPEMGEDLERMLGFMANVLVVEVFAEGTFQWGIDVLSDPDVSAAPEVAGDMVRNIQADEKPHVDYLRTALSEVSARTLHTVDGKKIAGKVVVDGLLHRVLSQMTKNRPSDQREDLNEGLTHAMQTAANPMALRGEFDALESPWTASAKTGFEPTGAAG